MEKLFIMMIAVLVVGSVYAAGDANQMKYVGIYAPSTSTNTTAAIVDVASYKGNCSVVAYFPTTESTDYVGTVTFAHCATTNGTYVTVTNLAGTAGVLTATGAASASVSTYAIDSGRLKKYVQATVTQISTNEITEAVSVILVAPMKSE